MKPSEWTWSRQHNQPCQVIETSSLWGSTRSRVWLPASSALAVVRSDALVPLSDVPAAEMPAVGYVAAAARVSDAVSQGLLLAPLRASVIPLPHQIRALSRAISGDRVRYLLADEVGLGKTIEAGLILRELKIRGGVRRTLIVVPGGLAAAPYLLPLSATPHQGKTDAFHRLMALLDDRAFPDPGSTTRSRIRPYVIRTEKRRAIDSRGQPLFQPRHTRLTPVTWKEHHRGQRFLYEALAASAPTLAPGQPIPHLRVSGLPPEMRGYWSLWRIAITGSGLPAAGPGQARDGDAGREALGRRIMPLYDQLRQSHEERLRREREKGEVSFGARRRAIARLGLASVRAHRLAQLETEERAWQERLERETAVSPELSPILLVRVEGAI